ncbi:MAG TPA: ABC transporter permease subunit [Gemmatimonadaceae bacterium]|nr:ABC transporter permease subunit [Gemmatimonadaceae bacterium]
MNAILRIARFGARDLVRSRWLLAYAAFFGIATWALLRFSDTEQKALLSLVNVVLFVVPLASIVFGSMYLYGAREFVELLLAQPVPRLRLFCGLFLGLTIPLAGAVAGGLAAPLLLHGASGESVRLAAILITLSIALSGAFTGLAAVITYRIEDRVRGLATALGVWLLLAVVYDGLTLMAATQFADYPIERPMLVAMIANPIDLARLLLLFQFDVAALLGYTGAVFQRFFEGALGLAIAAGALVFWTTVPAIAGARLFHRKDF